MTQTVANVLQGKPLTTGGILIGTAAATLPTTAVATTTGFTALGYVSEDGLSETADRSTDKIKAWGGEIVKVVQTEFSLTYAFTLYETLNADVLKAIHGDDNVTTTAATSTTGTLQSVKINSSTMPKLPWIFDMKDGLAKIRVAVPLGQVTTVGEITYNDGGVIGYPVTLDCFADASGNQAYKYIDNGVFSA
jgi:hypothetical protein